MRALTPDIIDTDAQFEALREPWTELLANSSSDGIFLTWEWMRTWWKHLAGGRTLHILVVGSGSDVWAIAPLAFPSTTLTRFAHIRTLEFLGTGSVGSDYLDIIVRRGKEAESTEILRAYFLRESFVLDLKQVCQKSAFVPRLAQGLQQERWRRSESQTGICPWIDLAGHTWESFQAGLGPNHRYNLQRRVKNLYRDFAVRFTRIASEDERSNALVALVTLHNKRMKERGGSDGLHSLELVAFHEEFTRLALARGWLRLFLLTLNGNHVAALYGFMYGKTFYFYQSGFDPAYSRHSVGLVVMALAIKDAINNGAEEFDMLHGDEKYKSLWAKKQRDLVRIELYPPTPRVWMYTKTIGAVRLARRAVRMSLTMLRAPVWGEGK